MHVFENVIDENKAIIISINISCFGVFLQMKALSYLKTPMYVFLFCFVFVLFFKKSKYTGQNKIRVKSLFVKNYDHVMETHFSIGLKVML